MIDPFNINQDIDDEQLPKVLLLGQNSKCLKSFIKLLDYDNKTNIYIDDASQDIIQHRLYLKAIKKDLIFIETPSNDVNLLNKLNNINNIQLVLIFVDNND